MNSQSGSGIMSNIATLGLPFGLTALSHIDRLKSKDNQSKQSSSKTDIQSKDKKGGAFAQNIIIEAGLSVVPFALIGSLEYFDKDKVETSSKNTRTDK